MTEQSNQSLPVPINLSTNIGPHTIIIAIPNLSTTIQVAMFMDDVIDAVNEFTNYVLPTLLLPIGNYVYQPTESIPWILGNRTWNVEVHLTIKTEADLNKPATFNPVREQFDQELKIKLWQPLRKIFAEHGTQDPYLDQPLPNGWTKMDPNTSNTPERPTILMRLRQFVEAPLWLFMAMAFVAITKNVMRKISIRTTELFLPSALENFRMPSHDQPAEPTDHVTPKADDQSTTEQ